MRSFTYITVGKILSDLKSEGVLISRPTFYRLESKLEFPNGEKSSGSWRVYTSLEALEIKSIIKKNYKLDSSSPLKMESFNPLDYLVRLYELKNKGIVTLKEFETKKKQILGI